MRTPHPDRFSMNGAGNDRLLANVKGYADGNLPLIEVGRQLGCVLTQLDGYEPVPSSIGLVNVVIRERAAHFPRFDKD